eukprot:TRINITY_DN45810_c0_g1_i1.p1 TRINITY_DN45810_c0_g1~~TRINITY_DN45810_c0_g1_i1.p1  ORF type:complete len:344 (+),score=62.99 TRINITY_DN45810_c0_g1_i1:97-1128(+)
MPNIEVLFGQSPVNLPVVGPIHKTVWLSPLELRFSQNNIYPRFSDGQGVDEALSQIRYVDDDASPNDVEGGGDLKLEPPFPTIEAALWSPKLRDGDGKPLLDANGVERLGEEALFSLDNRRLFVLQRAAVTRYPRRCKTAVAVIVSKEERARHVKKFRTRTNGLSVTICEMNGVGRDNAKDFTPIRLWDWRSAVAQVKAGNAQATESAERAASSGTCGSWQYLDGKGVHRGPFSHGMMRDWWERRMLPTDLKIRPYDPVAVAAEKAALTTTGEVAMPAYDFRLVVDVFAAAPAPFAPGWSPRAAKQEAEVGDFNECDQCGRSRLEGWSGGGKWYCAACWKRWE